MKKYRTPKLLHEDIMGKPFMPDMSEATERIRRNLLAVSVLTLSIHILEITPSTDSSFLGVKLFNFNLEKLDFILFFTCLYLSIHFLTRCDEFIKEVRIRLTGSDQKASRGSEDNYFHDAIVDWGDEKYYPSTLYRYWYSHMHLGHDSPERVLTQKISDLANHAPGEVDQLRESLRSAIESYASMSGRLSPILNQDRTSRSLERFDSWFSSLQKAYVLRVLIIEMGVPIMAGIAAMAFSFAGFSSTFLNFIWRI